MTDEYDWHAVHTRPATLPGCIPNAPEPMESQA